MIIAGLYEGGVVTALAMYPKQPFDFARTGTVSLMSTMTPMVLMLLGQNLRSVTFQSLYRLIILRVRF